MAGIEAKSFDEPDSTVTFDHGRVDLLKFGSLAIGREVPGTRMAMVSARQAHRRHRAGEFHHVSLLLEGRIGTECRDGEIREVTAGQVVDIAPGHDAWVVGEQPAVTIDFQGVLGWAKAPERASGDLGYIVGIVSIRGAEPEAYELRVTTIVACRSSIARVRHKLRLSKLLGRPKASFADELTVEGRRLEATAR